MNISSINCHVKLINPFGVLLTPCFLHQNITALPISLLRHLARQYSLVILRGFQSGFTDENKLIEYSECWGDIMKWSFGSVLDIQERSNPSDHVLDNGYIPLHWDGMYRETIPEFQIFHCIHAPVISQGGRTTFVNTEKLLNESSFEEVQLWKDTIISYKTKQVTHYGGEVVSPLVCLHPNNNKWVMRYNEPMKIDDDKYADHHSLTIKGMSRENQTLFEKELNGRLYDPRYYYAHSWEEGDVAICDNFTLLHGREAFISKAPRQLQRVHIHGVPVCKNAHFYSFTD